LRKSITISRRPQPLWLDSNKKASGKAGAVQYIHGDGANWIKEGINWLPESKLVLDKFHLNKAILKATARQPEKRRVYIGP